MSDNLTPPQRRKAMAAVKGENTSLERTVNRAFRSKRWKFSRNVRSLPGKPDFVFRSERFVVFVDGDFWHGWRFPAWSNTLTPYWRAKIARNRNRDRRQFRRLRRMGWTVLRVWGHDVERNLDYVVERTASILKSIRTGRNTTSARTKRR